MSPVISGMGNDRFLAVDYLTISSHHPHRGSGKCRIAECGMGIGLVLELWLYAVLRAVSRNFTHSASCRCGMATELRLGLGSVAGVRVRIRVSLRVEVMILFFHKYCAIPSILRIPHLYSLLVLLCISILFYKLCAIH